ncbi:MAG TPA: hypothetical protein VJ859_07920 [Allosphingosinicella sp.]|nr:hypothetical protein [Allosphingosinicella sp.]
MSEDEKAYFHRRAEEEIAHAQASTDERLVSFHYQLADLYLDLVFGDDAAISERRTG